MSRLTPESIRASQAEMPPIGTVNPQGHVWIDKDFRLHSTPGLQHLAPLPVLVAAGVRGARLNR